jgi:hypothetical protein
MVGSPCIVINKNGRRTLLNTAKITAVSFINRGNAPYSLGVST